MFRIHFFKKKFQEHYQSVQDQHSDLRTNCLDLGYQQMTKVAASKERFNPSSANHNKICLLLSSTEMF